MKWRIARLAIAAIVCALCLGASYASAHLAVAQNAAGALLSPAGLTDLEPLLIAGAYAFARIFGALSLCLLVSLAAFELTRALLRPERA
jgi:hypothetical protein